MIRMFLNKHIIFGLILLGFSSVFIASCAKNVETGQYEIDYNAVADAANTTAETIAYEGLKWLYVNKTDEVTPVYDEINLIIAKSKDYEDGTLTLGEVVSQVNDVAKDLNDRFHLVNSPTSELIYGGLSVVSGTLNIVLTTVHDNAVNIITKMSDGFSSGLTKYEAWVASQTAPPIS